jgi:hypothetical protein
VPDLAFLLFRCPVVTAPVFFQQRPRAGLIPVAEDWFSRSDFCLGRRFCVPLFGLSRTSRLIDFFVLLVLPVGASVFSHDRSS